MAHYSFDAIEIRTNDGYGNLVNYTDTALGFSGGICRIRTGRFTISSVSGDTAATTWYTGILTDGGISCHRGGDLDLGGGLSDASSLDFAVVNVDGFIQELEDNNIHLGKCQVKYFYATSSNGTAWTFYQRWQGVVDATPYNELTMRIQCIDNSKDFLTSLPALRVDKSRFPLAPPDSLDKPIPIAYGYCAYSPTVNVNESGARVMLCKISGTAYFVAACVFYEASTRSFSLNTFGVRFNPNDALLVGSHLTIVAGGSEQSRMIVSNFETTVAGGVYYTRLTLAEPLDVEKGIVVWSSGSGRQDVCYAEVSDYRANLLSSIDAIHSFVAGSGDSVQLSQFDDSAKKYVDVSVIQGAHSETAISNMGSPGVEVSSVNNLAVGSIDVYRPIIPARVVLSSLVNTSSAEVSTGDEMPNVIDKNRSTDYTFTNTTTSTMRIFFDVYLPDMNQIAGYNDIYLSLDFSEHASVGFTRDLSVHIDAYDMYGRLVDLGIDQNLMDSAIVAGSTYNRYYLPGSYYGVGPSSDDDGFHNNKTELNLTSLLQNKKAGLAYTRFRFEINRTSSGISSTYTLNLKQVGFVAKTTVRYTSEPIYHHLQGSIFGSTWNARRTAADPALLVGDVIEKMVRDHDYGYPKWVASRAYTVGQFIKPTADNKHFYRCTTAGTSGASEPTWGTTEGGTTADNTAVWTESGTYAIDEDAFDVLRASARSDWAIGYTLTEKKKTEDWLRDIAAQYFLGIRTNHQGELSPIAFLDQPTSLADFDETNSWGASEATMSSPQKVCNDLLLKYGWDFGSQSYTKQIYVTNIDAPAFPGINEVLSQGESLGTFTIFRQSSFSGGYHFKVVTDAPHGRSTGDYCSLVGNTHGFDFPPTKVSVMDPTTFYLPGQATSAVSSTSGALSINGTATIKWKTFVGGIAVYGTAKRLWERCHESFLVTKVINKLPDNLSDCYWIPDYSVLDTAGNPIWSYLYDTDDHPAYRMAIEHSRWAAWQKKKFSFSADKTVTNLGLLVYDRVSFNDAKLTGGTALNAYVTGIEDVPASGETKDHLRISIICEPELATVAPQRIIDTHGAADRIIDTPGYIDRILDVPA